jgi:hypothetical protein
MAHFYPHSLWVVVLFPDNLHFLHGIDAAEGVRLLLKSLQYGFSPLGGSLEFTEMTSEDPRGQNS